MGLDNRAYLRGMDEVERVTNETTQRMVRRHRTQVDDMKRRERDHARARAKMQQDFARGWQVATVAAAAGIATVVTSLDAAAQRNPVIKRQLDDISNAAREMRANIGEDIFGLGGSQFDETIQGLDRMRTKVVDLMAAAGSALFSGKRFGVAFAESMSNSAAVEAARRNSTLRTQRFEQEQNLINLRLQMQASIGNDADARRQLQERGDRDRINREAAGGGLSRTGVAELRSLVRALRETALATQRNIRLGDERDAIALGRAELDAQTASLRDPFNTRPQEQLELLRRRIDLRRQQLRIQKDEVLSEEEKVSILKDLNRLYGEQTRARIEIIRRENLARRRARDNRVSDSIASDRVGILRATGQDRLAEVESLYLGFSQRRRDIENDESLTGSQRESLLGSGAGLLRAQLSRLRRGSLSTVLEAGLAGGATLRRQILGADGRDDSGSPVISRIDTIIEKMDELIGGGGTATAVAAP